MYVNFSVIVAIVCENKKLRRYIRAAPRKSYIFTVYDVIPISYDAV